MNLETNTVLELGSVVLSVLFLVFLIKENKNCWFYGIGASLLSIFLFYRIHLYSESILYIYYVFIGFYGYFLWNKNEKENEVLRISLPGLSSHVLLFFIGVFSGGCLGYVFENFTDAENAYLDAFTTVFSFIASYLEARKVLTTWILWIFLNGVTIYLYSQKELDWYAGLTVLYTFFSFVGYFKWRKLFLGYALQEEK
jgi:nicotinamide mononucleotide transporter